MRDGTAPVRRLVDARRSGAARGREDVEVARQHGLRADRARNDDAAGAAALSPGQPLPPPVRSRRGEAGWSRGARVGACGDARPRRDRSPRPRCRDARGARGARRRSRHAHGDPCARARRAPRGRGLEAVAAAPRAPSAGHPVSQVELLTDILAREGAEALGWEHGRPGGAAARALLRPAARRIAREFADADAMLESRPLPDAARWILDHFSARVEVAGLDRVPGHGPILLVANHPGLTPRDRKRVATLLQMIDARCRPVTVRIAFGAPLEAERGATLNRELVARMRNLLSDPSAAWTPLSHRPSDPATTAA